MSLNMDPGDPGNYGITVRELRELLKTAHPDAVVSLEGCDCYGPCLDVHIDDAMHITLTRTKET